jgi:hypothetical protein
VASEVGSVVVAGSAGVMVAIVDGAMVEVVDEVMIGLTGHRMVVTMTIMVKVATIAPTES